MWSSNELVILMAAKRPEDLLLCHVVGTNQEQVLRSLRSHQDDIAFLSFDRHSRQRWLRGRRRSGATRRPPPMPRHDLREAAFGEVAVNPRQRGALRLRPAVISKFEIRDGDQ